MIEIVVGGDLDVWDVLGRFAPDGQGRGYVPEQGEVLFEFDAWEAFLHRAKKGWFDLTPPSTPSK